MPEYSFMDLEPRCNVAKIFLLEDIRARLPVLNESILPCNLCRAPQPCGEPQFLQHSYLMMSKTAPAKLNPQKKFETMDIWQSTCRHLQETIVGYFADCNIWTCRLMYRQQEKFLPLTIAKAQRWQIRWTSWPGLGLQCSTCAEHLLSCCSRP